MTIDPDLSFVATAGGDPDEPAVLLLPEHLADIAAFVRSQRAAGWREAIEALRKIIKSPECVPDTWLHAVDEQAPGRFGFGVFDSAEVSDMVRAIVAATASHLESLAPKETP